MKKYTHDEFLMAAHAMKRRGGRFARALGEAIILADGTNRRRIEGAFPEMLEFYLAINKKSKALEAHSKNRENTRGA